jgi:hypothetical protein
MLQAGRGGTSAVPVAGLVLPELARVEAALEGLKTVGDGWLVAAGGILPPGSASRGWMAAQ